MNRETLKNRCNRFSVILHAAAALVVYFVMEAVSRHSAAEAVSYVKTRPLVYLYNAAMIYTTSLVVYLVRRRIFIRLLLLVFWLGLGIVNGILLLYRVTPFTGPDLQLVGDALKLITVYMSIPMIIGAFAAILFVAAGLVLLWLKAPKYKGTLRYQINIPCFLLGALLFSLLTRAALENRLLSRYFGNIAIAYEEYGFPYCFSTTVFNTGIQMPEKYSQSGIAGIVEEVEVLADGTGLAELQEQTPNLIFLQLETFFDPTLVEFLEVSEDPIPNFRALSEQYSSGYFRVPSVGAGTANTEFEAITGMCLRYFGPGEYPYKTVLMKSTCESMAYNLKELGYTTHAIHNNDGDFYGRNQVFANLGFDTYTSIEYMQAEEFTATGWAKDIILVDQILECLSATEEQDYIYAISVQGHGEYPQHAVLEDPVIRISGDLSGEQKSQWEYYVNQLYEMDLFIEELLQALEEFGEDVVLVMYGDHLPTMNLTAKDLANRYLYQTEYVIWDNIGLEKQDQNLASYQIAAEVLEQLGLQEGTIFTYHQNRRNTKNYLLDLEALQYDLLYGDQYAYGEENPYQPADLKMGILDIGIRAVYYAQDTLYVYGYHFTDYSCVEVDGRQMPTEVVDSGTLIVRDLQLDGEAEICVVQISASSEAESLSGTEIYEWKES